MEEHPFAQYIRILGKGKRGQRALSQEEARDAMDMIYCYNVEPEQIGAFLMLMRVKEETAEEVAGFVQAVQKSIPKRENLPPLSIDWPAYAGKRRHMPWFLLAAILLSRNGYPVFMHGISRDDERVYAAQLLDELGITRHLSLSDAISSLRVNNFAYLDIEFLSVLTAELLDGRDILGLRSALHTVVRMINPLSADLSLQPVFHPNYAEIHQQASLLLGQGKSLSFRGEGGESERIPDRACTVFGVSEGNSWQEEWPSVLHPGKFRHGAFPDIKHFKSVWEEDEEDEYAEASVTGTMALCLKALNPGWTQEDALEDANRIWRERQGFQCEQRSVV